MKITGSGSKSIHVNMSSIVKIWVEGICKGDGGYEKNHYIGIFALTTAGVIVCLADYQKYNEHEQFLFEQTKAKLVYALDNSYENCKLTELKKEKSQ